MMEKTLYQYPSLNRFISQIQVIADETPLVFLTLLEKLLNNTTDILREISTEQRLGREESYTRHILYSDPRGRFTVMVLVWREGQFSPVHGHWTWCGYRVLKGEMAEEQFTWDEKKKSARISNTVVRGSGVVVVSPAGLDDIHRLGNSASQTALSLHVYGVDEESAATRVNRVVHCI